MRFSSHLIQWFPMIFMFLLSSTTAKRIHIPRLSPLGSSSMFEDSLMNLPATPISKDFQVFYYNQTLDHFNYKPESYTTFPQKYVINSKYWGGANVSAPILAYLGAESPLGTNLASIGFMSDNAIHFNALLLYMEHRYYGESIPFNSTGEDLTNATNLGYFSSAQAIADYVEIILHIKDKLQAQKSPVIVIGASYGGMLASWFRLKYPHVTLGALASSAPILYFDDITPSDGYYSVVSKDFKETSETCFQTIKQSWGEIDKVASLPNGLSILTEKFKLCSPLDDPFNLKDTLDTLYCATAQYNGPPRNRLATVCGGIDKAASAGEDILDSVQAGVVAAKGNLSCYSVGKSNASEYYGGWDWQTCTEMVFPVAHGNDSMSMFPSDTYDSNALVKKCRRKYGISPRPHWVTSYYGGHDIKSILQMFGSNIIFSNGLRDPYSIAGVLEDLSESLRAVYTVNGSHCVDMRPANETDPEWLVAQRKIEVKIVQEWISEYYAHLRNEASSKIDSARNISK